MDAKRFEGNWRRLKGRVREQWGELTDDDLIRVGGHQEALVGRIQERYKVSQEEARRQVDEFVRSL